MNIQRLANKIIDQNHSLDIDDAFYILNLDEVKRKYQNWIKNLPRIVPYYAVKCNDDDSILNVLKNCGTGFDCASKTEVSKILNLNVDPSRIIFAYTVKQVSHLKFACEKGVEKVTFDSEGELQKIKQFHPKAKLILRIKVDEFTKTKSKFGAEPKEEARHLVKMCKELKLNLIGISFHIGSGTTNFEAYGHAIDEAHEIFKHAENFGFKLYFLDIGGGYLGHNDAILKNYADVINPAIERNFPDNNIEIIAEPGQYFVTSSISVVTQVLLKKYSQNGHVNYFINDGVHGSFSCIGLYDQVVDLKVIRKSSHDDAVEKLSTIWGCTCSLRDIILENIMISEVNIGDWFIFSNMGAYSNVLSTEYCGFERRKIYNIENVEKCYD